MNANRKLTSKERTKAYAVYARKHGYYQRTVRDLWDLASKARREYRIKIGLNP